MEAAGILGGIKNPRAVDPLITTLNDEDGSVRANVVKALGRIKDPRTVGPLIGALTDKEKGVRQSAAKALGFKNDPRVIDPLIKALEEDEEIRASAILSLYRIGDSRSYKAFKRLSKGMNLKMIADSYRYSGEVKKGDEWVLMLALILNGNAGMAQAFLNSDNPLLFSTAWIWVNKHPPYTIKFRNR